MLKLAQKLQIDGIIFFATDPRIVTVAYVAEKMGLLSSAPYKSVVIMQNKDKFRDFLVDDGFNVPKHKLFISKENAFDNISDFIYPIIVRPVDSSGNKDVSKIVSLDNIDDELKKTMEYSFSYRIILAKKEKYYVIYHNVLCVADIGRTCKRKGINKYPWDRKKSIHLKISKN